MRKPKEREDLLYQNINASAFCLKRRSDIRSRLVDGELVVLDREAGFIHQLNKTATYIWEQCDGERTAAAIAVRVCDVFEVDESTALSDVLEILRRLQDLNLLENTEDANKNRKGVSYHV
jgi:Coenzyme PQQ synthesis protein D (PqqD)